ncbi:hypothetical protein M0657_011196 [Pyricularia oryzae]|uniref:Uncharacterized protein n=2 Tax=Pyricularia oryzae TaxID=318829 RepID=A0AA97NMW6_PYRO3|nr:hypothetical protein OOU_Y34scaffold00997g6 [Pyricularia oryzae Y34]KAI7910876.1 hypothetical protein M0657_011196 [Pyricularia oryzae]
MKSATIFATVATLALLPFGALAGKWRCNVKIYNDKRKYQGQASDDWGETLTIRGYTCYTDSYCKASCNGLPAGWTAEGTQLN